MTFDALDVLVVPFPFSDRDAAKRRPALVVSSPEFNRDHAQSILAMITSAGGPRWPSDVDLADWQAAGLTVPCRVRFKLFTLDDAMVLRRIGALSHGDAGAVRAGLARVLVVA